MPHEPMLRILRAPLPQHTEAQQVALAIEAARVQLARRPRRGPWIPRRRPPAAVIAGPNGAYRYDDWQAAPHLTSLARGEADQGAAPEPQQQTTPRFSRRCGRETI